MIRFNPFQPNNIASAELFAGRRDVLKKIETCLFQAKNGNPQHFLVQGERGIGKSSLLNIVDMISTGRLKPVASDKLNFLTIFVDIGAASRPVDLVRSIGRSLKSTLAEKQSFREQTSKVLDFLTQWEVLGVRYHKIAEEIDHEDARDQLVIYVADAIQQLRRRIDGVLILIDEADTTCDAVRLGEFCKLFTERLTRRECRNVVLGLAGLPTLMGGLKASHESSPRIFEIIKLDVLSPDERHDLLNRGMELAAERNGVRATLQPAAASLICELSEGYPHFMQQFAYFALERDTDDIIDVEDVKEGAYGEDGALMQLGDKYFRELFELRIQSDDYRKVLVAMASHSDRWVERKALIKDAGLGEKTVDNALVALKSREIVLVDDTRRGFYRLPTKSFAAWILARTELDAKKKG